MPIVTGVTGIGDFAFGFGDADVFARAEIGPGVSTCRVTSVESAAIGIGGVGACIMSEGGGGVPDPIRPDGVIAGFIPDGVMAGESPEGMPMGVRMPYAPLGIRAGVCIIPVGSPGPGITGPDKVVIGSPARHRENAS